MFNETRSIPGPASLRNLYGVPASEFDMVCYFVPGGGPVLSGLAEDHNEKC